MNISSKVKSNFKACSQTWDNKDGYVQPIISFRGTAIIVGVIVVMLVAAVLVG